jgi:branched-chain amino acid transport system permease protein
MLYREAGQFRTSYAADQQLLPIRQDRIAFFALLAVAFVVVPLSVSDYWFTALLIPTLIFALAAIGLNVLTGYAGQLSLGSAAFMAVGAFAAYNFVLRVPWLPQIVAFLLAGLCAAAVGIAFGLPSVRIKGFYLAVATLAAQFFVGWALQKFSWFTNDSASGVISAQPVTFFGLAIDTPVRNYLFVLAIVAVLALAAKNLARSNTGRKFMAVRDMDVAAEVIGIPLMRTKLLAFAISSFYCGVAGALYAFCYIGTVEPEAFSLDMSFRILFMIIVGGMGTIVGSFIGAAFFTVLPIFLSIAIPGLASLFHINFDKAGLTYLEYMIFGALIIGFLITEPHGIARLWQITKEKLRIWPFPHD